VERCLQRHRGRVCWASLEVVLIEVGRRTKSREPQPMLRRFWYHCNHNQRFGRHLAVGRCPGSSTTSNRRKVAAGARVHMRRVTRRGQRRGPPPPPPPLPPPPRRRHRRKGGAGGSRQRKENLQRQDRLHLRRRSSLKLCKGCCCWLGKGGMLEGGRAVRRMFRCVSNLVALKQHIQRGLRPTLSLPPGITIASPLSSISALYGCSKVLP
jgi:hypothetical protein